ncbi:plasmid transfer protein TraA [Streptomyces sp. NPDC056682]|uniref:plasmid transfer protein TraA n=1 Tax=Streptomyces sp. NPDC056682 TaxID=3345909 RepID=UPI0036A17885
MAANANQSNGLKPIPSMPTAKPRTTAPPATVAKTRNGGGLNITPSINPSVNISLQKNVGTQANGTGSNGPGSKGAPGGDFTSNEDIQAYCEHGRKAARTRAVERALDAAMLEGRLQNIPDSMGSMSGSRARARRVVRWLKRIAQAEKLIAKWYSALYAAFEREYESELMKIGKGRQQQKPHNNFRWLR